MITHQPVQARNIDEEIKNLGEQLNEKQSQANQVEDETNELANELNRLAAEYEEAYSQLEKLKDEIVHKKNELEITIEKLNERQKVLNNRLSDIYITGEVQPLELLLGAKSFQDFVSRLEFLMLIGDNDTRILKQIKEMKTTIEEAKARLEQDHLKQEKLCDELNQKQNEIDINLRRQQQVMSSLESDIGQLEKDKAAKIDEKKQLEAEKKRAMAESNQSNVNYSSKAINGFVFPVAGPHGYIDSWHYPRSGGRLHEGTDIFALKGTPLVACYKGIASSVEPYDDDLGGISLIIVGDDGNEYYYAHLNSIAPGISNGTPVKAGQLVGYVGNTGNARTTPPHLHFGIYPGGGSAINPYPILKAAE